MYVDSTPSWLDAARAHWNWRGQTRPPFAVVPGPGQVSVWDFPRPPRLVQDTREVVALQARRPDDDAGNEYQEHQGGVSTDQDGQYRPPHRVEIFTLRFQT